ncbi:hypothetical protein ACOI22_15330 [Glaciecola sp. 2405UD65-10]|uniref:hypothetical protein n=1 Tax=Glaciecola sp. 2405UD65-10 TaxID=3397244 RepID=UPI003B5B575D
MQVALDDLRGRGLSHDNEHLCAFGCGLNDEQITAFTVMTNLAPVMATTEEVM